MFGVHIFIMVLRKLEANSKNTVKVIIDIFKHNYLGDVEIIRSKFVILLITILILFVQNLR